MGVVKQKVSQLARLGRLNLTEQEEKELGEDLNEILSFAEKIKEVDTSDVEPTYHAVAVKNVFREDVTVPSPDVKRILEDAPKAVDGYFVVPRVIDRK